MIKTPLSVVRVAAFCLPLALVASCGGSETGAPANSTITVSPDEVLWEVTPALCTNAVLQDTYFNIVVKDPSGALMIGTDISVSLALTPGTLIVPPPPVGFPPLMYLYDDLDGDGLYLNPITVFPYYTKTNNFGSKMLRVQYDLSGCTYGGDLDVRSGSAYGSANISVKEGT